MSGISQLPKQLDTSGCQDYCDDDGMRYVAPLFEREMRQMKLAPYAPTIMVGRLIGAEFHD